MTVWVVSTLILACVECKNKEILSYSKSLLQTLNQELKKLEEFALFVIFLLEQEMNRVFVYDSSCLSYI